jgi:hypothetical protein
MTPIAASILGIGVGGVIGFGLHAEGLHARYVATPSEALFDEGVLMRDLANASIGVLSLGALLLLVDTLIWSTAEGPRPAPLAWTDGAFRF